MKSSVVDPEVLEIDSAQNKINQIEDISEWGSLMNIESMGEV